MTKIPTSLSDCWLIEPQVFGDARGFFFESFNQKKFTSLISSELTFVQDNHSKSAAGVLRGLHYQLKNPQAKLVRVTVGEIFDVAVDLRRHSPTFGQWFGVNLSAENKKQLWIPVGFAHGFVVLSDQSEVQYKTTDYYDPSNERCIVWNDPDLNIQWPLSQQPILSPKDQAGVSFKKAEYF